jgi:hypothetical protein
MYNVSWLDLACCFTKLLCHYGVMTIGKVISCGLSGSLIPNVSIENFVFIAIFSVTLQWVQVSSYSKLLELYLNIKKKSFHVVILYMHSLLCETVLEKLKLNMSFLISSHYVSLDYKLVC